MARVTVEDCLVAVPNRFALVHLATKRALQLRKDAEPLLETDNRECVTALREIADRRIHFEPTIEELLAGETRGRGRGRDGRRRSRRR